MKSINRIQMEMIPWHNHNFPDAPLWQPVMGAVEEVGALCHAALKQAQGIRTNEDHDKNIDDAIGDIVIYLMHVCNIRGKFLEDIVENTWSKVSQRDWKANPALKTS